MDITDEQKIKAHHAALEKAAGAVKEREDAIVVYKDGMEGVKIKLDHILNEIKEAHHKLSSIPDKEEHKQERDEVKQHIDTLERIEEAHAKEEIKGYEKNIHQAEAELAKANAYMHSLN